MIVFKRLMKALVLEIHLPPHNGQDPFEVAVKHARGSN